MWFQSVINIFAPLLIFLTLVIEGHSLKCFECKYPNCPNLGGIELECTTEIVLHTHEILVELNPSLESSVPADVDYACFQLNSSIVVDTGVFVPIVEYGCTFRQTTFCDGWEDDVVVHECQLCHTDACNAISGNVTDPPGSSTTINPNTDTTSGSSTTSTDNPNSTGGVDSKIHTGTNLAIGGLCLMLCFL